jgi:small-conductance mechanosensitive channel
MQLIVSLLLLLCIAFVTKAVLILIKKLAEKKSVGQNRLYYLNRFIIVVAIFLAVVGVLLVYSVDFRGLLVFASSVFAIVGVALFAQWSILSNVTASFLIFFNFPARVGECIKIIDGDNSVEGEIVEIGLFNTRLTDIDHNIVVYPNNLLLQKPVVKLPALTPKTKDEDA